MEHMAGATPRASRRDNIAPATGGVAAWRHGTCWNAIAAVPSTTQERENAKRATSVRGMHSKTRKKRPSRQMVQLMITMK